MLYELATGRLPFEVKTLVEAVKAHGQQPPPAPRTLKPEIPEALEKVILKAIEKEPAKRFQDAAAMAAALENALPAKPTQIGSAAAAAVAVSGGGTQFQEMGDQGRGASIMGEFNAPVPGQAGTAGRSRSRF